LATPLGAYVTDTTITVDGGVDAWGSAEPVPRPEFDERPAQPSR
jgi:citronellol/citronellal dehydrogenase